MDRQPSANRVQPLPRTGLDWIGLGCMVLLFLCSLVLFVQLMATNMLSNLYLIIAMVVLLVLNAAHVIVQLPLRRNKTGKLICSIISLILSAVMIYGIVAAGALQSALAKISGIMVEKKVMAVIVNVDDPATTINDTVGYDFGCVSSADRDLTDELLNEIAPVVGSVTPAEYNSPSELVDALYDNNVGAIIMNKSYISVLESNSNYSDFSERTRIIYEYTVEREVATKGSSDLTSQPFAIYLSGIDARNSDVNVQSKSDVNIVAIVNPQTYQILLVNTPRDYYLPLNFNGQMDKLTHAGLYGVEESMAILDNLYGIETDNYVRVNFAGLIEIVDALGGIDIHSDYTFTTKAMVIPGHDERIRFSFNEGDIHLNGEEALAFSRERYSFSDGDNQRGKNQMTVIKGIVKKASSKAVLSNYKNLLNAVSDAFITSFSYDDISSLVQMQLKKSPDWNITSYAVSGPCSMEYTYSAGNASVMQPNEEMVNTARQLINQVLNGEVPTVPEN